MSALETVKPSRLSLSANAWRNASVVPEITAVSKPNSSEPSAATIALKSSRPPPECELEARVDVSVGKLVCMTFRF